MAAEIVNLRRVRKARARDEKAAKAGASRARHGRTKAEETRDDLAAGRAARDLEGKRREPEDD